MDENLLIEIVANQGWEFPLIYPLDLDSKSVKDWGTFQSYLTLCGIINQDGKCICGEELSGKYELHHALVSRRDAMSLSNPELIHSSYNCLVLHHECHIITNRHDCQSMLVEIYGYDKVTDWYYSLPFKSKFRRLYAKIEHSDKLLLRQ